MPLIGRVVIKGIFEEQVMMMCLESICVRIVLFGNFEFKHSGVTVEAPYASHEGGRGGGGGGGEDTRIM